MWKPGMIELEKLKNLNHIIVHDNCPDGTASAMILKGVMGHARVTFCQYESDLQRTLPAEPGMIFCDFSPHMSRVQEFLDAGAIVLDHHGGPAAEVTKTFAAQGLGAFADEKADPGVSGALLAYNEVWLPLYEHYKTIDLHPDLYSLQQSEYIRDFATLAGIRDTWQRNDPRWPKACEQAEAVRFWPWDHIDSFNWNQWERDLLAIGPILIDRNNRHVQKCIDGAYKFVSQKGRRVTVFEGLKPTSDAAEVMGSENDLTIGLAFFMENGAPKMVFSTRSRGEFSCQNFALAHGGGGHQKAAGFSVELRPLDLQPFELAKRVLARYESYEDTWAQVTAAPDFSKKVKKGEIVPKELFDSIVNTGGMTP